MIKFPLNKIIKSELSWTCNVFEVGVINAGGLYIDNDQFETMNVLPFEDYAFRFYRRTKKIVISSNKPTEYEFCAIDLNYTLWRCLLCKKISKRSEPKCFCKSYSICWTPIDGEISGILFDNDCSFNYHFNDNSLSNLIL